MPSMNVFEAQDDAYRESVLPAAVDRRVAIEAGATGLWYRYVGSQGRVIGIDRFGASAPGGLLLKHLGFNVDNVIKTVKEIL